MPPPADRSPKDREVDELRQELVDLRRAIAASESRFESIVERSGDGILVIDTQGFIRFANAAAEAILGRRRRDIVGTDIGFPVVSGEVVEIELVRPGHQIAFADLRVVETDWDGEAAFLALFRDVTERHRLEEELAQRATHDALTGLPNRFLLEDRLQQALGRCDRAAHPVVVFFADLDGFKAVNDSFGHAAGDQVLIETARRIRASIRPADTAARVGGDEFVLVCESMEPAVGEAVMVRLATIFSKPMLVDAAEVVVGISVGMTLAHDSNTTPARLIADADTAMYRAKQRQSAGRGPAAGGS